MQTKTIDKLEDLKDYKWTYNGKDFILNCCNGGWILIQKNCIDFKGEVRNFPLMTITLKNLTELEFYGLKVILNEKPKLTREEKVFLELLEDNYVYIARSQDSSLSLFNDEPRQESEDWYISIDECEDDDYGILLLRQTFQFITWESGKAWSKAELMELKVID